MRRFLGLVIALCVWAVAALPSEAKTTLRITLQLPIKNHLGQNLLLFKKIVEERTKGEIEIQIFDSAQLYKDKQVPQAVGSGAIEMGVASLTRYVGDVPAVDIFYQPFMFNSEKLVRAATAKDSPVRKPLDEAILGTGARVLWWQAFGQAIMLSKGAPVKTPADMKNKKVRVFGKTLGKFVEAVGGKPVLMSGSRQYLAYQRGTVDIGMTGVSAVKSRKLWDVMDTITATNHADIEFIVVINEKVWQSLSDAHKKIIEEAAAIAEKDVRDKMAAIEADAYKAAKEHGMKVYTPTEAEIAEWRKGAAPVLEQYKKDAGALGAKVLAAALKLQKM